MISVSRIFVTIFYISFMAGNLAFGDDNYPTGLLPPTKEEEKLMEKKWKRIDYISPTILAVERINSARKKKRLHLLDREEIMRQWELDLDNAAAEPEGAFFPETAQVPYVDNSTLPAFPPIRSQGSLPSCAPFSITYYQLTHMIGLQRGWNNKNEENATKFSPKWSYNMINHGASQGTTFYSAFQVLEKHGAATWEEFPYIGNGSDPKNFREWCLDAEVWENAIQFRTDPVQYITGVNINTGLEQVKQHLQNGYVLIFGTYVHSWQYTAIADDPSTPEDDEFVGKPAGFWVNGYSGSHSMTVVGYDNHIWIDINGNNLVDVGEKGALRIANSWGQFWQDGGFAWLAYDALKQVSVVDGAPSENRTSAFHGDRGYLLIPKEFYEPDAVAEFTLNHAARSEMSIKLGISDRNETQPSQIWEPGALKFSGGAYAFDGTTEPIEATFVFDFSDIYVSADPKTFYLIINDNNSGNETWLKKFSVYSYEKDQRYNSDDVPLSVDNDELFASAAEYFDFPGTLRVGDVNGDGMDDIIAFDQGDAGTVRVVLSTGSDFGSATIWHDWFAPDSEIPHVGDVNGDGMADIITFVQGASGNVWVALSTASGFGPSTRWHEGFVPDNGTPQVADVNGDGMDDLIAFDQGDEGTVRVALSTGSDFGSATIWHGWFAPGNETPRVGDVNGDGMADIITFVQGASGNVWVALSTGSGFGPSTRWYEGFVPGDETPHVADVNGDGNADLIAFDQGDVGTVRVALSTGSGFGNVSIWNNWFAPGSEVPSAGDVTGDGMADAITFVRATSGNVWVAPSTGSYFETSSRWHQGFLSDV